MPDIISEHIWLGSVKCKHVVIFLQPPSPSWTEKSSMDQSSLKLAEISRDFIGKPKPVEPAPVPPLMSTLPKDPEELTHAELLQRFRELALRCFNKENQLDMAKELIKNLERVTLNQRVWIKQLEEERDKSVEVLKSLNIGAK